MRSSNLLRQETERRTELTFPELMCTWILDVLHFDDENTLWHVLIFSLSFLKENVAAVLQYHCINAPWALSIKYSIVFNIYVTL